MWNELESYKHHYLQMELPHRRPIDISPLVRAEFDATQSQRDQCRVPYTGPCEGSTYFQDRAQLAYGWFALPKLMRELCSDDREIRWKANNSLTEFLNNPLNAQRAINETCIVRLLNNAFLRLRFRWRDDELRMTESILSKFGILSVYLNGAKQIALKRTLCIELYTMLITDEEHMESVSRILRNLSEKPEVLNDILENTEFYQKLAEAFAFDVCRPHYPYTLWMHLSHFLEISPDKGVELGFFQILHKRIVGRLPKYHQLTMKCFGFLLRCEAGQKLFTDVDGVSLLYEILKNEKRLDTYQYLIMALLNGLQSKAAMWRCREFTDFPDIVFKLGSKKYKMTDPCKVKIEPPCSSMRDIQANCRKVPPLVFVGKENLQLYSFKTLRQMAEMPCIKNYIKANLLDDLKEVECFRESNECARDDLIQFLEREIYESNIPKN